MPIIPLIQDNRPLGNAAAPVLDNQRRPTVDLSGISREVGNLAQAGKMPEMSASDAAKPYEALGAVGRAVSQAGDAVGALAMKRVEAESDVQIAKADAEMQMRREDFENWKLQTNADPSTWDQEWTKRVGSMKQDIGGREDLHPGAKDAINLRLIRFEGMTRAQVAGDAAKQTFALAKSSFVGNIQDATETQDEGRFRENLDTAAKKGYLWPHEVAGYEKHFKATGERMAHETKSAAFDTALDGVTGLASNGGYDVTLKNIDGNAWGDFTDSEKERLRNAARQVSNRRATDEMDKLTDGIITGSITNEAKIDALDNPHVSPRVKEQAKGYLAKRDEIAEAKDRETNGERNFVELLPKVRAYDPAKDADGSKYFQLRRELSARVGHEDDGYLRAILYGKRTAQPPKIEANQELKHYLGETLGVIFDPKQGKVPWKKEVPDLDANGKPIKDSRGRIETKTVEDTAAKQRAIDAQAVIVTKFNAWMKLNPTEAQDPAVAKKKIMEFLPEGTRANVLDSMIQSSTPKAPTRKMSSANAAVTTELPIDGGDPLTGASVLPDIFALPQR